MFCNLFFFEGGGCISVMHYKLLVSVLLGFILLWVQCMLCKKTGNTCYLIFRGGGFSNKITLTNVASPVTALIYMYMYKYVTCKTHERTHGLVCINICPLLFIKLKLNIPHKLFKKICSKN